MSVLKQYNTGTSTWETIVVGQQGEPGIETGSVAPADTSVLWMDTADAGSQIAVPSGGNAGQVLAKSSATDYVTQWSDVNTTNFLINGAFDIWQRGTSFSSSSYTADRWYSPITSNCSVSQEASDLPVGFKFGTKFVTTGAGTFAQWQQAIESSTVALLRGKTVTISAYVKLSSNFVGSWYAQMYYNTATDALASQTTSILSAALANATTASSWTRISATVTVPADAVGLAAMFVPDTVQPTGVTVRMTGMQLEIGSSATPFKRNSPSIQAELAACQRYYTRLQGFNAYDAGIGQFAGTSQSMNRFQFPVQMRVTPTCATNITSISSGSQPGAGSAIGVYVGGIGWLTGTYSSNALSGADVYGVSLFVTGWAATSYVRNSFALGLGNTAYIEASAEL